MSDETIAIQLKKASATWNDRDDTGRPVIRRGGAVYKMPKTKAEELLRTGDWEKASDVKLRLGIATVATDIIIPTYNNEKLTVACVKSIRKHTKKDAYRIIWVDNNSKNPSAVTAALKGVESIHIHLTKNLGFVGAVNEGLRVSSAESICLLNNDTVVSTGWLEKLIRTLYSDPKIGIIGPLTENVGDIGIDSQHNIVYQAKLRKLPEFVCTNGEIDAEFDLAVFNKELEQMYSGQYDKPAGFVPFLCALIKREVLDAVGFPDTNFEMGMYDDNDYCHYAAKYGYKLALALDTCIYHKGRATFSVLQETEGLDIDSLLTRNYLYMQDKWNKK